MRLPFRFILVFLVCYVCNASLALGASVTITSSGGGVFVVQGDSMKGVAGVEMTIGYDSSQLASPSVRWRSLVAGALSIENTSTPGLVKIAIIKTDPITSANGPIASISFATKSGDCGITSVSAKLIDDKSVAVPVQTIIAAGAVCAAASDPVLITTPGIPFSHPEEIVVPSTSTPVPQTTTIIPSTTPVVIPTTTTTAAVTPNQLPKGLGTVIMPGDIQPQKDTRSAEPRVVTPLEPAETPETAPQQVKPSLPEKTAEETEPAGIKHTVYGGVLDRFRSYQGEKTPDIMIALFSKPVSPSIHQSPPVTISDGTTPVLVSVEQAAIKGTSTNFAFNGAKLLSMKKEDDSGRWILEIQPHVNSMVAFLTILNSSSMIDFPLTVVPPTPTITGKKADFAAFLKDSGAQAPKYDLNGDGHHDYLDDYIYTAHYLIRSSAAAK